MMEGESILVLVGVLVIVLEPRMTDDIEPDTETVYLKSKSSNSISLKRTSCVCIFTSHYCNDVESSLIN